MPFLGGLGLIVGFLARIAAFGIAIDMIVAVLLLHLPVGFFMNWYAPRKARAMNFTCWPLPSAS